MKANNSYKMTFGKELEVKLHWEIGEFTITVVAGNYHETEKTRVTPMCWEGILRRETIRIFKGKEDVTKDVLEEIWYDTFEASAENMAYAFAYAMKNSRMAVS